MPSVAGRTPPALPTPSSSRRIINRITSSFASRPRNITDFYVQPDDPHKQYSPGDVVTGSVRLSVVKPLRVTHIRVCLHGYVQVYKNPNAPGNEHKANYLGIGRGDKHGEYFGSGFATLFEDEVVLCGDGRLAEGPYQFNFELLFPDRSLPSSLKFERGTIAYLITATITRPTPINPTIEAEREIFFLESIDIASLFPPRPRTVTLSPVSKRSKARHTARKLVDPAERKGKKTDSATNSDTQRTSRASGSCLSNSPSVQLESEAPQSPGPSDERFDRDSADGSSMTDHYTQNSGSSDNGRTTTSKSSSSDRVITTTMEIMQGGCLRGDFVPIRVQISHTKPVKSLYGIIVTLFRHARVDLHPDIPLGPTEKGVDAKYEDYFPKSFSGLGGLSLSGAGSSHTYRKDLQQTFKPIMIDPSSLSTTVNAAIRVPEEAFPTMSTVPGGMISFKYYVEVVVDIQGKLASLDKGLGSLAGFTSPHLSLNDAYEGERSAYTPFGSNIVDTAPMKRHQGVINCTFELVVGTRDSERRKGKRKEPHPDQQPEPQAAAESQEPYDAGEYPYADPSWGPGQWYWQPYDHVDSYDYWHQGLHNSQYDQYPHQEHPPATYIPPPNMQDESQMSEKERIRQHETRVMPSQPPGAELQDGEASHSASAPFIPEGNGPSLLNIPNGYLAPQHLPDVPAYEPPQAGSSSQALATVATDDKQQIQRRAQLEAAASAPPPSSGDVNGEAGPVSLPNHEPSAPSPFGDRGNRVGQDSHADAEGSADLPMYER
ncbi:hypothetical protein K431DRAFT_215581 [Polychaeton citri CBS 116435]|uniref:Arrestin C-terminal-like domain-containing protein n=1 Tax=Polychaeton citri CBS 116435 TaxID=1314669 RepID=A0A9P4QIE5_9PEZI|nr:hypothetical protein K431DRAFT_215581 [Polychaeton citri CBS 116435]